MPFLIRLIAQRLVVITLSSFAFMGLNPDVSVPTPDVVQELQQRQDQLVEKVFAPNTEIVDGIGQNTVLSEVETKIVDIQNEFTETVVKPVTEVVEQTIPVDITKDENSSEVAFDVKDVVVNIVCLEQTSTFTRLSSGSGVLVSSSGLVITNAHVAYPFLQTKQFNKDTYTCTVRRADTANFGYNAELVYYPLDWLADNRDVIKDPSPIGTGEDDYAILLITSPLALAPNPGSFQFASLDVSSSDLKSDIPVTVAGYPSSNSGIFEIDTNPGLKVAQTYINEFFTFSTRSFDVMRTGINDVAKRGSSGGGVFKDNALYGIVVTTNDTGEGSYLNALTMPYIKDDFEKDTGMNLDEFVTTSLDILKLRFEISYKDTLSQIISSEN